VDIDLEWKGAAPDAAGHIIEYATEPQGEYTIIEFLPPRQNRFQHADLIPETTFYYRVRPFFGPASSVVELTMPEPLPGELENDDGAWARPQTLPVRASATPRPIRALTTDAAPTDLRGTLVHSAGVKLAWTDRASDEEGYLIEVKPQGSTEFSVAAVVDPDINSFGLVTLPNEKTLAFRVRAFYYGKPSNQAHQTTGAEPPRTDTQP
jgi:hypothetical protein